MPVNDEHPQIGDPVLYYDENRQPHAAIIAHIHDTYLDNTDRKICNLAMFKRDGRVANRVSVSPAFHDGEKWRLLNRWACRNEIPEGEWNYLPQPPISHKRSLSTGPGCGNSVDIPR